MLMVPVTGSWTKRLGLRVFVCGTQRCQRPSLTGWRKANAPVGVPDRLR